MRSPGLHDPVQGRKRRRVAVELPHTMPKWAFGGLSGGIGASGGHVQVISPVQDANRQELSWARVISIGAPIGSHFPPRGVQPMPRTATLARLRAEILFSRRPDE